MGCGDSKPIWKVDSRECIRPHTETPWARGFPGICVDCGSSIVTVDRPIVWQGKSHHWVDTERQLRKMGAY